MENTREEWLRWRQTGIGSSDAPIIHGISKYATPRQLWEGKLAEKFKEEESNFVLQMGNDLEPKARARFAALWNLENFPPPGEEETFEPRRVQMQDLPFMLASLDGASKDLETIIEIKFMSRPSVDDPNKLTPGKVKHLDVLDETLPITAFEGYRCRVPYMYWIQIQHQLAVTGAKRCFFISYEPAPVEGTPVSMNSCEVLPDVKFMESHIYRCCNFWEHVLHKSPPALVVADYKKLKVAGAKALAQKYRQTADGEEELFALMDQDLMHIDGVFLNRKDRTVRSKP